ncbi:MAG: hypothetical protein K2Q18_02965 [Bdellovibrionales bacterium]|nr:hypothetical protein [Bdellovibrionales bacterium]
MFTTAKLKAFLVASFIATIVLLPPVIHAEDCKDLLKALITKLDSDVAKTIDLDGHLNHRNFIAQLAKNNGIPVFLKQNNQGVEVPVILVNKNTAPKMAGFIENSFGTQVALQKDWNNDHGLLRAGNFIIDMDSPGARGYGEIEETGLAWKNVFTYLPRRAQFGGSPTLEVVYLLTPEEKSIVDYYQRVRRAAIFRVKFTFGGGEQADYPNLLKGGGEHCFIFCKAQAVNSHTTEMKGRLSNLGIQNPDALLKEPSIKAAIDAIQKEFNNFDPDELNSKMLSNKNVYKLFEKAFPAGSKDAMKAEIVNWLVSYDASTRYKKILNDLGVSGYYGTEDAVSKRASAIFVYDEGATAKQFKDATYSNDGKMVSWPGTKQRPID